MKLEIHERIAAISLLPKEGTFEALTTLRVAREVLSFTPKELAEFNIRNEVDPTTGKAVTRWDAAKASQAIKDVPLEEYTINVIRKALVEMDKKGKLVEDFLSLYTKFVLTYK
jgi:hypothetical protein